MTGAYLDRRRRIDALDRTIVEECALMNRTMYRTLAHVREFDELAGYLEWSFESCAQWLAWRCDIGMSAARERVRVAHTLEESADPGDTSWLARQADARVGPAAHLRRHRAGGRRRTGRRAAHRRAQAADDPARDQAGAVVTGPRLRVPRLHAHALRGRPSRAALGARW
jgi:hypothetical protein